MEPQKITMVPDSSESNRPKLAYRPAFKISDKTPESQVAGAKSFNEMRQRLLDLGEMETK